MDWAQRNEFIVDRTEIGCDCDPFVCDVVFKHLCVCAFVCVSGCSVKKLRCWTDDFKRLSGATAASNNRS